MLIMQVSREEKLKLFPYEGKWYAPTDSLPEKMEEDRKEYFRNALSVLGSYIAENQVNNADDMMQKMMLYQQKYGADDLPSPTRLKAEHIYNSIPFATILFMVCLTFAMLSLLGWKWIKRLSFIVLGLSFLALTFCLSLRWIVSGYIPMSNGYETMLIMAWMIMLASLLVYRKFHVILTFGLLLSGFLLLVSHLGQMDPKITPIMPVLSSPLLSIHVSCVMMAYGLFSITCLCGIYALIVRKKAEELHLLSQLFLYPAEFLLTAGIFIGAIWANVSWGRYWGWDPKEVWALITMLIYALPMHSSSIKWMRNPVHYHLFMAIAFLAVLITYFGVNFFLGGMHSYA
jgi:ABC-type transport system involved in cytochrome c biogenesis permease subunit